MMSRHPLTMAFAIVIITSCGVDYRKRTYEAVGSAARPAATMPSIHLVADSKNKMNIGPPYAAIVSMTTQSPFTVKSVVYEHDGAKVIALDASSSPLKSQSRSKTAKKMKRRFVEVPLADLKWLAGSALKLRAEVLPEGATEPLILERALRATEKERHYSCSEYYSMF